MSGKLPFWVSANKADIGPMKKILNENPGSTNKEIQVLLSINYDAVSRMVARLLEMKEEGGPDAWIFIQRRHGAHHYYPRWYARKNNIEPHIVAPKRPHAEKKVSVEEVSDLDAIRMANMWEAPKRLT